MSTSAIIIIMVIILFFSVSAIAVIQKREQEKAVKRQRIAQHRYRMSQAETILSNLSTLPIGPEARKIITQYGLANLFAIQKIAPDDQANNKNIESFKQRLENTMAAVDKQKLVIPADMMKLKQQINGLSNLAKFILKLNKSQAISSELVPVAINKIMSLISESKICAYVQQGKTSLENQEYIPAQTSFTMAQSMLTKIKNKNSRLTQIEEELQELIKSTPAEALNKDLNFNQQAAPVPAEEEDSNSEEIQSRRDQLFGPKKKW